MRDEERWVRDGGGWIMEGREVGWGMAKLA